MHRSLKKIAFSVTVNVKVYRTAHKKILLTRDQLPTPMGMYDLALREVSQLFVKISRDVPAFLHLLVLIFIGIRDMRRDIMIIWNSFYIILLRLGRMIILFVIYMICTTKILVSNENN